MKKRLKKVMMVSIVLCLGLLLVAGCGTEEEDIPPSLSEGEKAEKLKDLAMFCNEHREKLNEMSEYFLNAVEDLSDYEDESKLPDIDELAAALTDEESKAILEKLDPYYPGGTGAEFKAVFYFYEGDYENADFMVVYIEEDGRKLENIFNTNKVCWQEVRKIDKHLFAVIEEWPLV